eukprot:4062957-Alexandrium_andersonii.AAC.1
MWRNVLLQPPIHTISRPPPSTDGAPRHKPRAAPGDAPLRRWQDGWPLVSLGTVAGSSPPWCF